MTTATRDALHRVADILREAGWDAPPAGPAEPAVEQVGRRLEAVRAELRLDEATFRRAVLAAVGGGR